ncbi:MAG: glycoside hydrolase family 30 beta sandwich domain-containing protein [Ruthenibacterium lactatiformans]|uniref:glycoside hydrolase family 30 beta sandwich domain-containing protein n=1 Tax=Ruthenibacterium lactatiformans TaxID=1550024 RepID=UPI003995414F
MRPGAQKLAFSRYTDALEMTAFLQPGGHVVVVVMNPGETAVPFTLCDVSSGRFCPLEIPAHAIWTILYET